MSTPKPPANNINHPAHYGGADNPYEVVKVAEAWGFDKNAYLFNVLKYVGRCDKKNAPIEDLEKAAWYLQREINNRKIALQAQATERAERAKQAISNGQTDFAAADYTGPHDEECTCHRCRGVSNAS